VKVVWDEAKNVANKKKHRVSFEEASVLFSTELDYLEIFDHEHSETEDRFIAIGPIRRGIILIVWTEQDEDEVRIISARWAKAPERLLFHEYLGRKV
jgi:uncharacterized DUF497 family protein